MNGSRSVVAILLLVSLFTVDAADSNEFLKEAREYLTQGKVDAAVIQLKNALQENPANIDARLLLGKVYLRLNDGEAAEKEIERAVRLKAGKELWQLDLGQAYLLQRKFDEILDSIEPDPTLSGAVQAGVYNLRGQAYLATGKLTDARDSFQKSLSSQPGNEPAELGITQVTIASGDQAEGRKLLDDFLGKHPDNFDARILRGDFLKQQQHTDQALEDFDYVLNKDHNNIRALLGRTIVQLQKANYDLAAKDLEVLNKIAPNSPIVIYLNGVSAFQQQKIKEAEEFIRQVLNLIPNHPQSQLIYGAILFGNGEFQQADEYLSRAQAALPGHLPTIKLLAATRIKLRQHDKAIALLESGLTEHPEDVQLRAMLGNAYLQTGRFEEGSELLAKAVEQAPDLATLRTQLAFGLLARGETKSAIDELQSAVDLGQDLIQADVLLVLSHLKNNESDKALQASQALEKRSPDNPLAYNLTGLAYLASGNEDKAREKFLKALAVDPSFVTAQINLARIEFSHNRLDETAERFQAVLEKVPNNITALLGMAGIEELRNNRTKMYEWLAKAQQENPKSSQPGVLMAQAYLRDGENLKALRTARETISSFPNNADALRVLGMAQIAVNEINSAIQSFTHLSDVQKTPQNLTLLANALKRVDNHNEARSRLKQALEADPSYLPALSAQGDIALREGKLEEAIAVAKTIQGKHPQQSVGHELEAVALIKQSKTAEAITVYEKAYELNPTGDLALKLSRLHIMMGNRQQGQGKLEDWLTKRPEDAEVRAVYASLLQQWGDEEKAIAEYETVLQKLPDNVVVLNNLAWLYQKSKNDRAIALSERAFNLSPDKPEIVDTYGWILVNFGQFEKGLKFIKEAFAKMPGNPEVAFHVGYALNKAGKSEEAKRVLERIVKDHKESPYAGEAKALAATLD